MNLDYIKCTLRHKIAFLRVEKQLLVRNSLRGIFHDLDKIFLYLFLEKEYVNKIHKKRRHNSPRTEKIFLK